MCRLLAILTVLLTITTAGYTMDGIALFAAGTPDRIGPMDAEELREMQDSVRETLRNTFSNLDLYMPDGYPFSFNESFAGGTMLKWPSKKISIDVKDANMKRLAELLSSQTGIRFTIGEGVPSDLKITIRVDNMGIKQFLDTLTATTSLMYKAESREKDDAKAKAEEAARAEGHMQLRTGDAKDGESQTKVYRFFTEARNVTDVMIYSLRGKGVVVNMGRVSASLKNADPIDAVTNLIKQINGAGYVVMNLDDYLALQDNEKAEEIRAGVQKSSRPKIDLELRNASVMDALKKLSDAGHFYITMPKPGISNYLIIPDVTVTKKDVLPGLQPNHSGRQQLRAVPAPDSLGLSSQL